MTGPVLSVAERFIPGNNFSTTALADGSLVATYTKGITGGGFQIVREILNADGTSKTGPLVIFSRTGGEHLGTIATKLSNGQFVVAWQSDDSGLGDYVLKYQIFKADGSAASSILTIGTPENSIHRPQITALANGSFAISYNQGSSLKSAFFSASGTMSQEAVLGPTSFGSMAVATLKNGSYLTVAAKLVDSGGTDLVAYIRKPTGEVTTQTLTHSADGDTPEVTVLANGNFLVVWKEGASTGSVSFKANLFNADGNPIGENLPLIQGDGITIGSYAVKALPNGGFALAYTDWNYDSISGSSSEDLLLATYSATGVLVDSPAIVKAQITDSFIDPSIEVLKDGRYVLSYERGHYQIFDPRPSAVSWTGTGASEQYGGTRYGDRLNGSSGNDKLYGFDGNDILSGGTGVDYLIGGIGSDKIYGGDGKDVLYGGTGRDTFVFNTRLGSAYVDKIADYNVADDTIHLENRYLTKLKAGKLASSAYWTGSKAHDASDRIIYDKYKGYLYYDADGTGASKQVLIATLSKSLKMSYAEFYVI